MGVTDWIIGGGLATLLLGIVGYFGRTWMSKMEVITEAMAKNITSMEKLIAVMDSSVKTHNEIMEKTFQEHREWLNELDMLSKTNSERISRIETTCQLRHTPRARK